MLKETIFMVGSPGKRAMLADMWESGQCGVSGFGFVSQSCVGSDGLSASLLAKAISLPTLIADL
jgi:hypothetical protein